MMNVYFDDGFTVKFCGCSSCSTMIPEDDCSFQYSGYGYSITFSDGNVCSTFDSLGFNGGGVLVHVLKAFVDYPMVGMNDIVSGSFVRDLSLGDFVLKFSDFLNDSDCPLPLTVVDVNFLIDDFNSYCLSV